MKFEFVEYYQLTRIKPHQLLIGTFHIYCVDYQIDFRGMKVFRKKEGQKLALRTPFTSQWDPEEKRDVNFPIYSFAKESDFLDLKQFLFEECYQIIMPKVDWTKIPAYKEFEKKSIPPKAK